MSAGAEGRGLACFRWGCTQEATEALHAPLTGKDGAACPEHVQQAIGIGWERVSPCACAHCHNIPAPGQTLCRVCRESCTPAPGRTPSSEEPLKAGDIVTDGYGNYARVERVLSPVPPEDDETAPAGNDQ